MSSEPKRFRRDGRAMPIGRPFQKGKSGNPEGLPRGYAKLRDELKELDRKYSGPELDVLAKRHTLAALETIAEIMHDDGVAPGVRLAAALALHDRGWGKPKQSVDLNAKIDFREQFNSFARSLNLDPNQSAEAARAGIEEIEEINVAASGDAPRLPLIEMNGRHDAD